MEGHSDDDYRLVTDYVLRVSFRNSAGDSELLENHTPLAAQIYLTEIFSIRRKLSVVRQA